MLTTDESPLLVKAARLEGHVAADARDGSEDLPNPDSTELIAAETISQADFYWMLPVLILGISLMTSDAAVEMASYFQIGDAFNQLQNVVWLTISYLIAVTITQPLYSRLSDIYGRKPLLLCSYGAFGVGIVIFSSSFNFWLLVIARGVVGSGSSGMGYMVSLIFNDIISLRDRALWQSGIEGCSFAGQLVGGPLGGLVVDKLGWRLAFLLELPFALVLVLWGGQVIRLPKLPMHSYHRDRATTFLEHLRIGMFDVSGSIIFIFALAALLLGLNLAGGYVAWTHPMIPVLFAFSTILFTTFAWFELTVARVPLVPVKLLATREVMAIMGTMFFSSTFSFAFIFSIPYYMKISGRGAAMIGGVMNAIFKAGSVAGYFLAGIYVQRTGRPWYALVTGAIAGVYSSVWIKLRWTNAEDTWENIVPILLGGMASGATIAPLHVILLKVTRKEGSLFKKLWPLRGIIANNEFTDRAIMFGVFHIFINIAGMISLSCIAATIQYRFGQHLLLDLGKDLAGDVEKIFRQCMKSSKCLNDYSQEKRILIRQAFVQALGDSFGLVCVAAVGIVLFAVGVPLNEIDALDQ